MPYASAEIKGNYLAPKLSGIVNFYEWMDGVMVLAEVANLPTNSATNFFAFHIHEGTSCGEFNTKFEDAKGHYNPSNVPHPLHAGDMPPLFGNNGYAYLSFYTTRFKLQDIINKTIIIHAGPDDFTSQPAGNAGDRIGCGIIVQKNES